MITTTMAAIEENLRPAEREYRLSNLRSVARFEAEYDSRYDRVADRLDRAIEQVRERRSALRVDC